MSFTGSAIGSRVLFNLRSDRQLFIGVSSCTGPIMKEELQTVMPGWGVGNVGELTSSSTFAV